MLGNNESLIIGTIIWLSLSIWFDLNLFEYFTIRSANKHFYLREFFQQYQVSNKRIRGMKQIFIELIRQFFQIRLINSKVKLMLHNNYIDIEDLTTFNISDGFILYEKISNK